MHEKVPDIYKLVLRNMKFFLNQFSRCNIHATIFMVNDALNSVTYTKQGNSHLLSKFNYMIDSCLLLHHPLAAAYKNNQWQYKFLMQ